MPRSINVLLALPVFAAAFTAKVDAQQVDNDLMMKWSNASIVRFQVVGEYKGDATIMASQKVRRDAHVADHVSLAFNWNQAENTIVGNPTIKNSASTAVIIPVTGCPAARISRAYDHWDVQSSVTVANTLRLSGLKTFAAGSVPYANEKTCGTYWDDVDQPAATVTMMLPIPSTLVFAMPAALGEGMVLSADKKSIVVTNPDGWTWTFTPTIVK